MINVIADNYYVKIANEIWGCLNSLAKYHDDLVTIANKSIRNNTITVDEVILIMIAIGAVSCRIEVLNGLVEKQVYDEAIEELANSTDTVH